MLTTLSLNFLQVSTSATPSNLFDIGVFLAGASAVLGAGGLVIRWVYPLLKNGGRGSRSDAQAAEARAFSDGSFQGRVLALIETGQAQQERMAEILDRQIQEGQESRAVLMQLTGVLEGVSKSLTEHQEASSVAMGQVDALYKVIVRGEKRSRPGRGG